MSLRFSLLLILTLSSLTVSKTFKSEILSNEQITNLGIIPRGNSTNNSHLGLTAPETYPENFSWCDKDGVNYCTVSRN